jgi:hypothetical protein
MRPYLVAFEWAMRSAGRPRRPPRRHRAASLGHLWRNAGHFWARAAGVFLVRRLERRMAPPMRQRAALAHRKAQPALTEKSREGVVGAGG